MNATQKSSDVVRTTLTIHELLTAPYIPLSEAAMHEVGSAAQTLGGLYKITGKETFVPVSKIALQSRVPPRTCEKQIDRLHAAGWIANKGRERTRAGVLRRTATYSLTAKATKSKAPFFRLPDYFAVRIDREKLTWKSRAVLAVICSTYNMLCDSPALEEHVDEEGDFLLEEFEDRFRFSLTRLERQTGLHRESVVEAKHELKRLGLVDWTGRENATDLIIPRADFQIIKSVDQETGGFWLEVVR